MAYQKLSHRQDRLRLCRLLIDLAQVFSVSVYGSEPLGSSFDGLLVFAGVVIGHADNRVMNVSKLSHYLGMTRQTISRRLDELIKLGVVERTGQHYHISKERNASTSILHLQRANSLIIAAFNDIQRNGTTP